MRRLPRSVLLVVLCATVLVSGGAAGQTDGVTLNTTVDGEPVADGDRLVSAERPTVSVSATSNETIRAVFVRVDGEDRYRNLSVGRENFSLTRELSLGPGSHDVAVIVSTDERTKSVQFQYLRDLQGPVINFSRPLNVSLDSTKQVETNNTQYRLAFETRDFVDIERVDIVVDYFGDRDINANASNDGDNGTLTRPIETETISLDSSSRSFDRAVAVGPGTTVLTVETEDAFGNIRQKRIGVTLVDDGTPPSIEATSANFTFVNETQRLTVDQPTFNWRGTVTDSTGIRSVVATATNAGGSSRRVTLLGSPPSNRTEGRQRQTFERKLELEPGANYFNLTATDLFGNNNETAYRITYDPITLAERVEPEIRLYRNRSRVDGDETRLFVEITDGTVRSVVVEVQGLTTRETAFVDVVHSGENRSRVVSNRALPITEERTQIAVKTVDAVGNEHVATLVVDRDRGQFVVGNRTESGFVVYGGPQTVTPTPTATPAEVTPTVETDRSSTPGTQTGSTTANNTDESERSPGATTAPGPAETTRDFTPATATLRASGTAGRSSGFLAPTGGVLGGTVALLALVVALVVGLSVRVRG